MDILNDLSRSFATYFASDRAVAVYEALLLLVVGYGAARLVSALLVRFVKKRTTAHHAMVLRRVSFYMILGIFGAWALVAAGFDMGILLGAAGVLTVALGFASQTSASNIISGLFLIGERPFEIGDVIRVGTTTGEVLSIDLLSVKLRTFDNLFVRIANENLIKSEIINLSRFPIRRIDIPINVAYRENLSHVVEVITGVANDNPLCFQEPKPLFIFNQYAESAVSFQFSVWTLQEHFLDVKNQLYVQIKAAFDLHGIEIPVPHRKLVMDADGASGAGRPAWGTPIQAQAAAGTTGTSTQNVAP